MSVLGPGGLSRIPLASSAAAGAHAPANSDEVQANRDAARAHADEAKLTNRELGDNLETQVNDRDPDGRLPWTFRRAPGQEEEDPADKDPKKKSTPPDSELGRKLDVDV